MFKRVLNTPLNKTFQNLQKQPAPEACNFIKKETLVQGYSDVLRGYRKGPVA